jgi:hypothetical protein
MPPREDGKKGNDVLDREHGSLLEDLQPEQWGAVQHVQQNLHKGP